MFAANVYITENTKLAEARSRNIAFMKSARYRIPARFWILGQYI